MDQSRRSQIGSMHDNQRQMASTYKPSVPAIPTAHGCSGDCTIQPPPPPVSNTTEGFSNMTDVSKWWMIVGGATAVFVLVCLHKHYLKK